MATTSVRAVQRVIFVLALIFTPIFSYSQVDHWETAVYETDTWRYLIPSNAVSGTWNTIGFNDASWSTGQGGFGYGDGDDNTTFSATVSCYQRKIFTITNLAAIDQAILNIDYDDAFVAYLNGVKVAQRNAPEVTEDASTAPSPRIASDNNGRGTESTARAVG